MKDVSEKMRGFTLIEITVSLLIASILVSIAALGIAQGTKAFVMVKDYAAVSQKAQVAINRLTKEFTNLQKVDSVVGTPPNYDGAKVITLKKNPSTGQIEYLTQEITLKEGAVQINDNKLVDSVSSFTLGLKKGDASKSDWTIADLDKDLVTVEIKLTLTTASGDTAQFINYVSPRYNENTGGGTNSPIL